MVMIVSIFQISQRESQRKLKSLPENLRQRPDSMVMLQTSPVTTRDSISKHRLKKNNQKRFGERLTSGGLKNEARATGSSTQPSQEEPLRRVGMAKTKGLAPKEICTAGTETPTRQFPKQLYPKPSGPLRDSKSS